MRKYELIPTDGRKSFYGKAVVMVQDDGSEILYSYGTKIIEKTPGGGFIKFWGGWSQTAGRHIKAFCGLNKLQYEALQMNEESRPGSGGRTLSNQESLFIMLARRAAK